jgi:hypothetical protein
MTPSRPDGERWLELALALVGAGEALLLAHGVELCFGIGGYRRVMLFGILAGLGLALLVWLVRRDSPPSGRPPVRRLAAAAGPACAVFAVYALVRILPLVREELEYFR